MGNKVCCAPKEQDLRDLSDAKPMEKKRQGTTNISDKKPKILSCDYGMESP